MNSVMLPTWDTKSCGMRYCIITALKLVNGCIVRASVTYLWFVTDESGVPDEPERVKHS